MASYAGAGDSFLQQPCSAFLDDRSGRIYGFNHPHSLSMPNLAVKPPSSVICTATKSKNSNGGVPDYPVSKPAAYFVDVTPYEGLVNGEEYDYEYPRVSDKLDEWMRDSVTEIVKNINQAPLLVQIYADGEVKTEKAAAAENWPDFVRDKSSSPDGIILVEELRDGGTTADLDDEIDGTKAFGVLIQGKFKGKRCKSACYLLKTSRVDGGMGIICTHFCLMKVKNLRESAFSQLNDCWLLR